MTLPKLPAADGVGLRWQEGFGGLSMGLAAADGEIADMGNLTGDHFPVLSPRAPRRFLRQLTQPGGLGAKDKLFWTEGTGFYYDGALKGAVTVGAKRFFCLNAWIVIWPDKKYYNTRTQEFGSLEASLTAANAVFRSGDAPGGISTDANCLCLPEADVSVFRAGDGVAITGCTARPANERTLVVREVSGDCLYFYDDSFSLETADCAELPYGLNAGSYYFLCSSNEVFYNFTLASDLYAGSRIVAPFDAGSVTVYPSAGASYELELALGRFADTELPMTTCCLPQTEASVTVSRSVPDMDFLCQCDNRLWGAKDDSLFCSALGDPRVWNNFDGTATTCWSVDVGSAGAFTGAFAYGGYPLFFKEDHIYRVYGTKPANYQLLDTETLGCETGSDKSFAVVGQTLYYKSRAGFAAYAGGVPKLVDAALGTARRQNAVAGTDGRKYYVSCTDGEAWSLFVYDTQSGLWHREDASCVTDFVWCGGELHMLRGGELWMLGRIRSEAGVAEGAVESFCEFADCGGEQGGKTGVGRIYFLVQTENELTAYIQYDGSGVWERAQSIGGSPMAVRTMQLIPRRCGRFRLKLCGVGDWKLRAMGREYYQGSMLP